MDYKIKADCDHICCQTRTQIKNAQLDNKGNTQGTPWEIHPVVSDECKSIVVT